MKEVWDNVSTDGVMTKAQELEMSVDLPPEIPGYVDTEFKDVQNKCANSTVSSPGTNGRIEARNIVS